MALAPQNMPVQTPNFTGGGSPSQMQQQAPQMASNGKPAKPTVHGLVDAGEIDTRIAQLPREAQQYFAKAVMAYPELPTIFGIAVGPEAHDYVVAVQQALKQAADAQQQNSPDQGGPSADPMAGQNPQADAGAPAPDAAGGQPPAMATPTPPQA
jgi:hypothetical protein